MCRLPWVNVILQDLFLFTSLLLCNKPSRGYPWKNSMPSYKWCYLKKNIRGLDLYIEWKTFGLLRIVFKRKTHLNLILLRFQRNRRIPKKWENNETSSPNTFKTPKEYNKALYIVMSYETFKFMKRCNLALLSGLHQQVIAVEQECLLLVNRGETNFEKSTELFTNDLDIDRLRLNLNMSADIANKKTTDLKKTTCAM